MNKWIAEKVELTDNTLEILVNGDQSQEYLNELQAAGQILVDSDNLTFVYILEDKDGYAHLRIPATFWEVLNEGRKASENAYVVVSNREESKRIALTNFFIELNTLIENIDGNANYGENLVSAVEKSFKQ